MTGFSKMETAGINIAFVTKKFSIIYRSRAVYGLIVPSRFFATKEDKRQTLIKYMYFPFS